MDQSGIIYRPCNQLLQCRICRKLHLLRFLTSLDRLHQCLRAAKWLSRNWTHLLWVTLAVEFRKNPNKIVVRNSMWCFIGTHFTKIGTTILLQWNQDNLSIKCKLRLLCCLKWKSLRLQIYQWLRIRSILSQVSSRLNRKGQMRKVCFNRPRMVMSSPRNHW